MKVVFDNMVFSCQRAGGVSIVWYELLKRVLLNKNFKSYYLECKSFKNIYRHSLFIPNDDIKYMSHWAIKLKKYLNPTIDVKDKFIFHSPYYRVATNKKAINVVTVHDFIYEYFSQGIRKKIHCWQKYHSIKNAEAIICVSENTKRDLLKFLPQINNNKIHVVYNGVSDEYYPLYDKPLNIPFSNNDSYVLFVGLRSKYKNFELAVKAVAASKLNLVIVGSPFSKKEKKNIDMTLGIGRYNHLGYVETKDLNKLYNNAYALLYPSSYEGFGIPVLEAQKAGCPVIAYNASSIPEIIGDTPLLLNELSVDSILSCFEILKEKEVRNAIVRTGLENASRFSWDTMYSKIIQIYNEVWHSN